MQGWLRTKQAASYCNISERTLADWLKSGLRSAKVRGCLLIKREWLDDYIERFEVKNNEQQLNDIVSEAMKNFEVKK